MSRTANVPQPASDNSKAPRAPLVTIVTAWVAVAAAAVYFVWRGAWRATVNSQDLTVGYAAARAWLGGRNPYNASVLADEIARGGNAEWATSGLMDVLLNIYFPTSLPLYAPLSGLSWHGAKLTWLALNLLAVGMIAGGLIRYLDWRVNTPRSLALLAFVLALAPVQSTIGLGQTAVVATALLVSAMLLEKRGLGMWAGIAYGLAIAVKVQIGLPFLAYILWRRRWGTAATAGMLLAMLTISSIARMEAANVPWYASWTENVTSTTTGGGHNDAGRENPGNHSLINLHYPLHQVIDNRFAVNAIVLLLVGAGAGWTVYHIRGKHPSRDHELLALSIVGMLCLLVTYHRTYDAVLIALPLAWALFALTTPYRRAAILVLILSLDFLLPVQTMLFVWQQQGRFPSWMTDNFFWNGVVLTQQVWAVILIALALLYAARQAKIESVKT